MQRNCFLIDEISIRGFKKKYATKKRISEK